MTGFQELAQAEKMDQATLSQVSQLARQLVVLISIAEHEEEKLKATRENIRRISEEALPQAMTVLGLESLKLEDGSTVKVEQKYFCGIPEKHALQAFQWLRDHNCDSMIKNTIVAVFGKGEDSRAKALAEVAASLGIDYVSKEAVHPSTLKAFVKEKDEAGQPVPEDLFGVHKVKQASVKVRK